MRKAESIFIRGTSRSHAEKLIDDYLTKHPGPHFASEIAEALGLELRTTLEAIKRMIDSGKIHKARSEAT
jgi:DNA-binding MarR family transcriptional regulator